MSGPNDPIKSIGKLLKGSEQRDAIHVAILPVKAGEPLVQGTTVKVENGRAMHASRAESIGIIDPFLTEEVEAGQRCWVFLFPGTITGMRHHWALPAVDGTESEEKAKSKAWLETYASMTRTDYEELIEQVTAFVEDGCSSATMDDKFHGWEVPDEFWVHFKVVTGLQGQGHFWTCCL